MLSLWRRHTSKCPHARKGRGHTKCPCPVWVDVEIDGKRLRQSLDTRDWQRAIRKAAAMEAGDAIPRKPVAEATEAFLLGRQVEPSTACKYKRIMNRLAEFAAARGIVMLDQLNLESLDAYRATRKLRALSWSKELQLLRTFFEYCRKRRWCQENPAQDMDMPPDPKPRPREPYTAEEIAKIIAATDAFGKGQYERLRARAMILLMRYYGLRVSDVATLRRDRIRGNQIFLHALKNGAAIWLPLYAEVDFALCAVPKPYGAEENGPYVFWSGRGDVEEHTKTIGRTLQAVFLKSGVPGATSHRFRHTLATEVLVKGGSIEDAANLLGDSPNIIRKHYAKWSTAYQQRTVELFRKIHGMYTAHEKIAPVTNVFSVDIVVPGVGLVLRPRIEKT